MFLDTQNQSEWRSVYRLLTALVQPRPIAWVSSRGADGQLNLAPFSFFNVVCPNPPVIVFCPVQGASPGPKDTLRNVQENPEFVIQVVSRPLAEKMNLTSGEFSREVNEFEVAGLTPAPSRTVSVPRVKEAYAHLECRLYQVIPVGEGPGSGTLVLGQVQCIEIDDSVMDGTRVDTDKLAPIGRLAGSEYSTVEHRFALDRPDPEVLGRPGR